MMDYNEISDVDYLDVVEFTEFENFKKELISVDILSGTDNLSNVKNENIIRRRKHKKSTIKCEICGRLFQTNTRYERHKFNHFRNVFVQCNECGKLSSNRRALINHIKFNHMSVKSERQMCKICGKSVLQMNVHMQNHTNAKFKCDKCKKCFRSNSYYVEHYKTHFEKKDFHCEICGGDFTRKRYLNIHMAKHEMKGNNNKLLFLQTKPRKSYGANINVNNKKNESKIIDQRTVGCDTSDLQSNITTDGPVVLFPLLKWQENREEIIPELVVTDEKWTKALFNSQCVDTSDIDYYLDLLGQIGSI